MLQYELMVAELWLSEHHAVTLTVSKSVVCSVPPLLLSLLKHTQPDPRMIRPDEERSHTSAFEYGYRLTDVLPYN